MMSHKEFLLRRPKHTSLNLVRAFCRENVEAFFRNLDAVIHAFGESEIWNINETAFPMVLATIGQSYQLETYSIYFHTFV